MNWMLLPALLAATLMAAVGLAALLKPDSLRMVGLAAESPLGSSEIRAVFGGMFLALGIACLWLREPLVFAVVGAAWFADLAARLISTFVDRVPARDALPVLGIALAMGAALVSGYWFA